MTWLGIRTDITPVADVPGSAEYIANARLRKADELARRYGYLSTAIAKQTGPIRFIVSANTTHGNFLTFNVADAVIGYGSRGGGDVFPPPPVGPKIIPPIGEAGTPVAPVITNITASPPSPSPQPVVPVTFTATVTYDGLSGPLTWLWTLILDAGPSNQVPPTNTNPASWNISGAGAWIWHVRATAGALQSDAYVLNYTTT